MLSAPRHPLPEIEHRIKADKLSAAGQRVDRSDLIRARIGTCEQVLLPAWSDSAQGALSARVVDLYQFIIDIARASAYRMAAGVSDFAASVLSLCSSR
jgi:hypothetical protein